MLLLCFVFFWYLFAQNWDREPDRFLEQSFQWLMKATLQDPREVLLTSMPALAGQDTPEEMESPARVMSSWVTGLVGVDLSPKGILMAQIPLLAEISPPAAPVVTVTSRDSEKIGDLSAKPNLSKDTLVGIYNTHTGESYAFNGGTERVEGGRGGVVGVAREVQEVLEQEFAIRVSLSDKIHDKQYATSYLESEKTVQELVEQNPKLMALIDIHRDAGRSREASLVEVNGKKTASILIIIGSDARSPFPEWRKNYQFACRLAEKMDEMYPGLCLGVRVKDGRYNQFLHERAILVEVGTTNNSLEEAKASGAMFAKALAQVIEEDLKETKPTTSSDKEIPGGLIEPETPSEAKENQGKTVAAPLKSL